MPKKKIEWSKLLCTIIALLFGLYSIWCGTEYYHLCNLAIINGGMMPDASLAIAGMTTVIAALVSYLLYQAGLKNSRNKYGIGSDGQPFKQQQIDSEEDFNGLD